MLVRRDTLFPSVECSAPIDEARVRQLDEAREADKATAITVSEATSGAFLRIVARASPMSATAAAAERNMT